MKGSDPMGSKYTEAQKQATLSYLKDKTDDVRIRVPKGTKDEWKAAAERDGKSLQRFVIDCVENHIEKDGAK